MSGTVVGYAATLSLCDVEYQQRHALWDVQYRYAMSGTESGYATPRYWSRSWARCRKVTPQCPKLQSCKSNTTGKQTHLDVKHERESNTRPRSSGSQNRTRETLLLGQRAPDLWCLVFDFAAGVLDRPPALRGTEWGAPPL
eukprot:787356-Rhodomonas_salina.1